jgi:hypothetical protein
MADLKHVGRSIKGQRKCAVAYRVVPNDPEYCLVVYSDTLEAADHASLMNLIESNAGQNANEFAEAMHRTSLSDGRNMLVHFSATGKLSKVKTSEIEMTPNTQTSINLAELNNMIAEQRGVTVNDLAMSDGQPKKQPTESTDSVENLATVEETPVAADDGVLTDEQLAAQYRSQADALFKEAKALREQAEELVPTKKKAKAKTTESA